MAQNGCNLSHPGFYNKPGFAQLLIKSYRPLNNYHKKNKMAEIVTGHQNQGRMVL